MGIIKNLKNTWNGWTGTEKTIFVVETFIDAGIDLLAGKVFKLLVSKNDSKLSRAVMGLGLGVITAVTEFHVGETIAETVDSMFGDFQNEGEDDE